MAEKKELNFVYDAEGDILDISVGAPQGAISNEIADDFFVRIHPETKQIVGFSILNFRKQLAQKTITIPVSAEFSL
jgi:uncharacterized protein YuzE